MAYDKVVDSTALDAGLTTIANAIRAKGGTTEPLEFPQGMADAVAAISGGGGDPDDEKLMNALAADDGTGITEINLSASYIRDNLCTNRVRYSWRGVRKVDIPNATRIGGSALIAVDRAPYLNAPNVTYIKAGGLWGFNLSGFVDLSSVEELEKNAIRECAGKELFLPALKSNKNQGVVKSEFLKIDIGQNLKTVGESAFWANSNLTALIIRNSASVPELTATNAFAETPIVSGTGYIYVPKALVEQYKSATNWAIFASQIRAIEDYPEITGGTV